MSRLGTIDINVSSEEAARDCVPIASPTSDKPIHLSKDDGDGDHLLKMAITVAKPAWSSTALYYIFLLSGIWNIV